MRGMTAPECPVCATPHEAGAEHCAFCGVSLREPPPQVEADAEIEPEAETSTPAEDPRHRRPPRSSRRSTSLKSPKPPRSPRTIRRPKRPKRLKPPSRGSGRNRRPNRKPAKTPTHRKPGNPGPATSRAPRTRTPSFARKPTTASTATTRGRIEWSVVAGLAALLVLQSVAADFGQSPATPPPARGCSAPARSCVAPAAVARTAGIAIAATRRERESGSPGVLRISASFRNDARWRNPGRACA